jgi:hypothetical protein
VLASATSLLRRAPGLGLLATLMALGGCDPIPHWSLGAGGYTACTDAGDIACAPFGAPVIVAEIQAPQGYDEKPTLTADLLQMYFLSTRDGGPGSGDVWYTERASPTDAWGAPSLVDAVSGTSRETSPALSSDGATLWFGSDRDGGIGGLDIWVSTRDTTTDAGWSTPVPVTELNSSSDEIPRPPGDHGLEMPLSRRKDSNASYQMYSSIRPAASVSATWSTPAPIASVNTADLDDDGFLTDDGLTLYFSSDRLNGTQDLFVTERPDLASPFAPAIPMASLNTSSYDERDPWVSPDGHEIFFTSDRTGGERQIFHATR